MKTEITFEEAVKHLEEIIKQMESGGLALEESLKRFEEGVSLIDYCNQLLNRYEKKITLVMEKDGKLEEKEIV